MQSVYNDSIAMAEKKLINQPWENATYYGWYLAQTFYFVSHSCRLLAASASYFDVSKDALFKRFTAHINEEKNHEVVTVNDLKALGSNLSNFIELPITKVFYESQYYKIERKDPTALLGYIIFLEGVSVDVYPKIFSRIENAHGKSATRFLNLHIKEDPTHIDLALKFASELPQAQQDLIRDNIFQTSDIYFKILDDCKVKSKSVA